MEEKLTLYGLTQKEKREVLWFIGRTYGMGKLAETVDIEDFTIAYDEDAAHFVYGGYLYEKDATHQVRVGNGIPMHKIGSERMVESASLGGCELGELQQIMKESFIAKKKYIEDMQDKYDR